LLIEQGETAKNGNGGNIGFEAELFKAADKLRGKKITGCACDFESTVAVSSDAPIGATSSIEA